MLSAVSVLAAQNIGAGKYKRAEKTLQYTMIMCVSFGIVVAFIVQLSSNSIIGLFSHDKEVIKLGSQYIRGYIFDGIFAGIHFSFSGYFCACGKSEISFFHNMISIMLVRIPLAYFASKLFTDTLFPMGLVTSAGSILSSFICIIFYINMKRKDNFKYNIKNVN